LVKGKGKGKGKGKEAKEKKRKEKKRKEKRKEKKRKEKIPVGYKSGKTQIGVRADEKSPYNTSSFFASPLFHFSFPNSCLPKPKGSKYLLLPSSPFFHLSFSLLSFTIPFLVPLLAYPQSNGRS